MPKSPENYTILKMSIGTVLALGSLTLGSRLQAEKEAIAPVFLEQANPQNAQCLAPMTGAVGCHEVTAIPVEPEKISELESPATTTTAIEAPVTTTLPTTTQTEKPEITSSPTTRAPAASLSTQAKTGFDEDESESLGMFESTCYSLDGITASGRPVGQGIVAVDPRVIPLGTHLFVEGYGSAVAADTGGAIKGRIVDVWLPTDSQCFAWGRQQVEIWSD